MKEALDEQAVAAMELDQIQALIDHALTPQVPIRVFFAALDRLTELSRTPARRLSADTPE